MISYEYIYEAARKERHSEQLQPLSKKFVEEVAEYIKEKKEFLKREGDSFSEDVIKTKKQLENAITLFKELMLRRRKKILDLVLIASETGISKHDFENMLGFEKELFENIMVQIDATDKKINELLNGSVDRDLRNELITFLEDIDEFVGMDGNSFGPFEKGQVANLPKNIADILIEEGKAKKIED